jgi:hypothetical protein
MIEVKEAGHALSCLFPTQRHAPVPKKWTASGERAYPQALVLRLSARLLWEELGVFLLLAGGQWQGRGARGCSVVEARAYPIFGNAFSS